MSKVEFNTSIKPSLLKRKLFVGTLSALFGASILFFMGIFFDVTALDQFGLIGFLTSIALIAIGLIPYRKLQRLELKPDKLIVSENAVSYVKGGKPAFTIPWDGISKTVYFEKGLNYGILLELKSSRRIFLPYFNKRAAEEFAELIS